MSKAEAGLYGMTVQGRPLGPLGGGEAVATGHFQGNQDHLPPGAGLASFVVLVLANAG
jgi:hypothetical protein